MAKIIPNDRGFKVICLSDTDAISLHFGFWSRNEDEYKCICMNCNKECKSGDIYYIAVLNDIMCKDCFDKWLKSAKRYKEDIPIEEKNFKFYWEWLNPKG